MIMSKCLKTPNMYNKMTNLKILFQIVKTLHYQWQARSNQSSSLLSHICKEKLVYISLVSKYALLLFLNKQVSFFLNLFTNYCYILIKTNCFIYFYTK